MELEFPYYLRSEIPINSYIESSNQYGELGMRFMGYNAQMLASIGIRKDFTNFWVHVMYNNKVIEYLFNYKSVTKCIMKVNIEYETQKSYMFFGLISYNHILKKYVVIEIDKC